MNSKIWNLGIVSFALGLSVSSYADEANVESSSASSTSQISAEVIVTAQRMPTSESADSNVWPIATDAHDLVLEDLAVRLRATETSNANRELDI